MKCSTNNTNIKQKQLEDNHSLYHSTDYSCMFVFNSSLRYLEKKPIFIHIHIPIVWQCPVKSTNLNFRSTEKYENDNTTTIYVSFRFNLFLVSEKIIVIFPYDKTITCDGNHLGFAIDTKTPFCKRPFKEHSNHVCWVMIWDFK